MRSRGGDLAAWLNGLDEGEAIDRKEFRRPREITENNLSRLEIERISSLAGLQQEALALARELNAEGTKDVVSGGELSNSFGNQTGYGPLRVPAL